MPNLNAALSLIDRMGDTQIIVMGDIMLDRFVYGDVGRISPEAPIPVLSTKDEKLMLGGAGNVVSNLLGLHTHVHLITAVGADETADVLAAQLQEHGGDKMTADLVVDAARPTSTKTRYLAGHQQLLRVDTEKTVPLSEALEDELFNKLQAADKAAKTLILSDYGKGVLSAGLIARVIEYCRDQDITVLVDPKGTDYSRYKGAHVVTPNKKELSEAVQNMATDSDADVVAATDHLLKTSGIESVVATRSADGMTIRSAASRDGEDASAAVTHLPTIAREVYDVSGAGDTVIATIAAALAAGADLVTAAAIANAAGGLVVEKVGTAAIRSGELRGFLLEDGHRLFTAQDQDIAAADNMAQNAAGLYTRAGMAGAAPVMNWHDAADQVARWKARGLDVGFTNGAFDILHQGHVTYLAKSRALCDRLVVGLNCDASIKRYKSEDRPINDEEARANVLSCLQSVDMVVLFGATPEEEDTPLMLMQALRPDMITKGADYTIDQVVGADFVSSYGGRVELIDLEEGFSTTNTIKKMTDAA